MEENLFKEEMKPENEEFVDDSNSRPAAVNVTLIQLQNFAEKVAPDWKKLAMKLGITKTLNKRAKLLLKTKF